MKIGILSRSRNLYSTKRIKEVCKARGHTVKILDTGDFFINVERGNPDLLYRNKPLEEFDAIIPRIGSSITFFGAAVVRQFEQMGVYCLNTSTGINTSRDKLRSIQLLSRHRIGIPHTIFVKHGNQILPAIECLGGAPVIIKLLEGTQGIGVILADSNNVAKAIIETMQSTKQNVLIQQYVKESKGSDIRVIVAGDKVIAAMRRVAKKGEFRSNVHRGGSVEAIDLDEKYARTAIKAAQLIGLNFAGVDILEGKNGPMIIEVNSSPGLEGIERATGIDVAGAMIDYLEDQCDFPEIDLRQRLTMDRGYGVMELHIYKNSDLIGKTIKQAQFRNNDIMIMNIVRDKTTISIPKGEREILLGDVLLCFGKLSNMKKFIVSHRVRRKKRQKVVDDE